MMSPHKIAKHKAYWEENIKDFSGFYNETSKEGLSKAGWIAPFYKKIIFPLEKKQMLKRHQFVLAFINEHVKEGMKVADIGCGSGLYTKVLLEKGANVIATDFAQTALYLTREKLTEEELTRCEMILHDISSSPIPKVDIVLCIGVLPYIDNFDIITKHVLPFTDKVLFNFMRNDNVFNQVRKHISILNVRDYSFFDTKFVKKNILDNNFRISGELKLGTGHMFEAYAYEE
ncbi:MAG: class I SAM-dependent methyltransferase [Bacteroidetes bacterium]|nr:class I SAM-dependent methyltransferase [Bacteroidota bacterium]